MISKSNFIGFDWNESSTRICKLKDRKVKEPSRIEDKVANRPEENYTVLDWRFVNKLTK